MGGLPCKAAADNQHLRAVAAFVMGASDTVDAVIDRGLLEYLTKDERAKVLQWSEEYCDKGNEFLDYVRSYEYRFIELAEKYAQKDVDGEYGSGSGSGGKKP